MTKIELIEMLKGVGDDVELRCEIKIHNETFELDFEEVIESNDKYLILIAMSQF